MEDARAMVLPPLEQLPVGMPATTRDRHTFLLVACCVLNYQLHSRPPLVGMKLNSPWRIDYEDKRGRLLQENEKIVEELATSLSENHQSMLREMLR